MVTPAWILLVPQPCYSASENTAQAVLGLVPKQQWDAQSQVRLGSQRSNFLSSSSFTHLFLQQGVGQMEHVEGNRPLLEYGASQIDQKSNQV